MKCQGKTDTYVTYMQNFKNKKPAQVDRYREQTGHYQRQRGIVGKMGEEGQNTEISEINVMGIQPMAW